MSGCQKIFYIPVNSPSPLLLSISHSSSWFVMPSGPKLTLFTFVKFKTDSACSKKFLTNSSHIVSLQTESAWAGNLYCKHHHYQNKLTTSLRVLHHILASEQPVSPVHEVPNTVELMWNISHTITSWPSCAGHQSESWSGYKREQQRQCRWAGYFNHRDTMCCIAIGGQSFGAFFGFFPYIQILKHRSIK